VPRKKTESNKPKLHEVSRILHKCEDVIVPPYQPESKGLIPGQEEFANLCDPSRVSAFASATATFNDAMGSFNGAYSSSVSILKSARYSIAREHTQPAYIRKLQGLIDAGNQYINEIRAVDSKRKLVFGAENRKVNTDFINQFIVILGRSSLDPFAREAIPQLLKFRDLLDRVFEAQDKIGSFEDEFSKVTLTLTESILATFVTILANNLFKPLSGILSYAKDIYESMQVANAKVNSAYAALHNVENIMIEARILIFTNPDLDSIQSYLKINRDLLNLQISFLEIFNNTSDPVIKLWPVFNRDLLRSQEKEKPIAGNLLLKQKQNDIRVFAPEFAKELVPLIDTLNKSDMININLITSIGKPDEHLAILTDLYKAAPIKQNALVKAIVLATIINCYISKNGELIKAGDKKSNLHKDLGIQIDHLRDFINNLIALKLVWNKQLFQFVNNFIFIKHYIYEATSATEFAFLACEIIFKRIATNNLPLKNKVIEMQVELLKMQNTMLDFIKTVCIEDFVKKFYFMNKNRNGFLFYDTIDRNNALALKEERLKIIQGIAIDEIRARNAKAILELEAIPLEFQAKQRQPDGTDYLRAISSGDELEKYLLQWEQEDAQKQELQHALEEKHHKAQAKQKQKKQNRKAHQVKKDEKGQSDKTVAVIAKPATKLAEDPLTLTLNKLLLRLNPLKFCAEAVKEVICELYPLTLASTNNELVFNALSAIGDSYSMIATQHLNHAKLDPKILLVNLKLVLNFYGRAELVLSKITDISFEAHNNYYTWLRHSVGKQQNLLERSIRKLTSRAEQLALSKARRKAELGDEWYTNHLKPGWKKSYLTLQAEELQSAFNAMNAVSDNFSEVVTPAVAHARKENSSIQTLETLQEKCKELEDRLQGQIYELVNNQQAYAFEYYLNRAVAKPLPEPQPEPDLEEDVAFVEVLAPEPDIEDVLNVVAAAQLQALSALTQFVLYHSPSLFQSFSYPPFMFSYDNMTSGFPYIDSTLLAMQLRGAQTLAISPSKSRDYVAPPLLREHLRYPNLHAPSAGQAIQGAAVPIQYHVPPFANIGAYFQYWQGMTGYAPQPQPQFQMQIGCALPPRQPRPEQHGYLDLSSKCL